jgi:hypothetical protein
VRAEQCRNAPTHSVRLRHTCILIGLIAGAFAKAALSSPNVTAVEKAPARHVKFFYDRVPIDPVWPDGAREKLWKPQAVRP